MVLRKANMDLLDINLELRMQDAEDWELILLAKKAISELKLRIKGRQQKWLK